MAGLSARHFFKDYFLTTEHTEHTEKNKYTKKSKETQGFP